MGAIFPFLFEAFLLIVTMTHGAQALPSWSYHCELLCFAVNKLDTMPYDVLVKTCANFYSPEKIQEAKDLLAVVGNGHGGVPW